MNRSWIKAFSAIGFSEGNRKTVLLWAGAAIGAIAAVDWHFEEDISFGFLYLYPMLMVGGWLTRWQIAGVAALCTGFNEAFDQYPWATPVGIPRLILTFAAFYGAGLYGFAAARSREQARQHVGEMQREMELRRQTEEQLEFVISSSPATIFTLDAKGRVMLANDAAHLLLRVEKGSLEGKPIGPFFPALASVPASTRDSPFFHTEMECRGRRKDGDVFLAHIWFSTYQTTSGPRLAAVVFDASEELRDRAEFSLQQILTGSKVLIGALCHEIRNLCGAIAVVHSKLSRNPEQEHNEDFSALGMLVNGLGELAGLELRQTTQPSAESIEVRSMLEDLRIVIEPSFEESGMSIEWEIAEPLPLAWADRQALLQAFLNIAKNSQRAMEGQEEKKFRVRASAERSFVAVRFMDSGPGVAHPERLFAPFQPGAQASGLGLYLSRAFVRAFQGDIEYEPRTRGCCFVVLLAAAEDYQARLAEKN